MDKKNEEIVKEISTLLLTLTGCTEDSLDKSGFKVFKSFTGYISETIKALEKESLISFRAQVEAEDEVEGIL